MADQVKCELRVCSVRSPTGYCTAAACKCMGALQEASENSRLKNKLLVFQEYVDSQRQWSGVLPNSAEFFKRAQNEFKAMLEFERVIAEFNIHWRYHHDRDGFE